MRIQFTVTAIPVAQPRQRHSIIAGHVHNYTPSNSPVNVFKAQCRLALHQVYSGPPLEGAIRMDITAVFPRPKNKIWKTKPMIREPHITKPDRDNIEKSVQDSLNGLAYRDDSQIWFGQTMKVIADGNEQPHIEIFIEGV